MSDPTQQQPLVFPKAGACARRWARFERDLAVWLESPEGRFAIWRAQAQLPPDRDGGDTALSS